MRAYELVETENTETAEYSEEEYNKVIELIQAQCQPYIKVLRKSFKQPLFRGLRKELSTIYSIIKPRLDRKPSDTPVAIHDALNASFKEQFGFPYRNGIFCTGRMATASEYGTAVVVFPIGELQYVWCTIVRDLYQSIVGNYDEDRKFAKVTSHNPDHEQGEPDWIVDNEKIDSMVSKYTTNLIEIAIQGGNEVMLANDCIVISVPTYKHIMTTLLEFK